MPLNRTIKNSSNFYNIYYKQIYTNLSQQSVNLLFYKLTNSKA